MARDRARPQLREPSRAAAAERMDPPRSPRWSFSASRSIGMPRIRCTSDRGATGSHAIFRWPLLSALAPSSVRWRIGNGLSFVPWTSANRAMTDITHPRNQQFSPGWNVLADRESARPTDFDHITDVLSQHEPKHRGNLKKAAGFDLETSTAPIVCLSAAAHGMLQSSRRPRQTPTTNRRTNGRVFCSHFSFLGRAAMCSSPDGSPRAIPIRTAVAQ